MKSTALTKSVVLKESRCGNEILEEGEQCDFKSVGECPQPWGLCWRCGKDCTPYLQHRREPDPARVFSDIIPRKPFRQIIARYDDVPVRFTAHLDDKGRRTSITEDHGDDGSIDARIDRRFGPFGLESAKHFKSGRVVMERKILYDQQGRPTQDSIYHFDTFDNNRSLAREHRFSYSASKTTEMVEGELNKVITTTPFKDPALPRIVQKRSERVDRNRDGRDDLERIQYLDAQGVLVKRTLDLYRDGIAENLRLYDEEGQWIREESYSSDAGELLNVTQFRFQSGELIRRWSTTPAGVVEEDTRRQLSEWGRPLLEENVVDGRPLRIWEMETVDSKYQRPLHSQRYFPDSTILEDDVTYSYQAKGDNLVIRHIVKRRSEQSQALALHRDQSYERNRQNRTLWTERHHPGVFHSKARNRARHRLHKLIYDEVKLEALQKVAPRARPHRVYEPGTN